MRLTIKITKQNLFILCAVIVICSGVIVYAWDSGTPSIMGHTWNEMECDSNICIAETGKLQLGFSPTEDTDAVNKQYVDFKNEFQSRGVFANVMVNCVGGIIDNGATFTCNSPRGSGYFEPSTSITNKNFIRTASTGHPICLALGGINMSDSIMSAGVGSGYIAYSTTTHIWTFTETTSIWTTFQSITCNK